MAVFKKGIGLTSLKCIGSIQQCIQLTLLEHTYMVHRQLNMKTMCSEGQYASEEILTGEERILPEDIPLCDHLTHIIGKITLWRLLGDVPRRYRHMAEVLPNKGHVHHWNTLKTMATTTNLD